MDPFYGKHKCECFYGRHFRIHEEVRASVVEYIEIFLTGEECILFIAVLRENDIGNVDRFVYTNLSTFPMLKIKEIGIDKWLSEQKEEHTCKCGRRKLWFATECIHEEYDT